MNLFFNLNEISKLTSKAELGCIDRYEHSYLQKMIAAQTVINQYIKKINPKDNHFEFVADRYYNWICKNWQKKHISKRDKTDLFLLKNSLEKVNYFKKSNLNAVYQKPMDHYDTLKVLSEIWDIPLNKDQNSILYFLKYFMENIYGIPKKIIEIIFNLILSNWKPILSPLGSLSNKKYSLQEIEDYFFGNNIKPNFNIHIIEKIDRYFSVVGIGHTNHIFLSKKNNFDLFEAALVIHELQHIIDAIHETNEEEKLIKDDSLQNQKITENLFLSEKNALNAERVFLLGNGTAKRGRYYWLESNLFYPILLLKCELHNLIYRDEKPIDFAEMCQAHGMEPLPLSSLFGWGAPFQMSVYCASTLELEPNWLKFLQ